MATTSDESKQLVAYWTKRVEQDLTPFIDPGTILDVKGRGRSLNVSWVRRGRKQNVTFLISREEGVTASIDGRHIPYRSFFASPLMADLLALAKMTLQAQRARPFVDTKATRLDISTSDAPALTVLQRTLSEELDEEVTLVVMVTGEAGTGKTSVLKQLVKNQSEMYVQGKTQCLYLYVNAQGRALARFNEALATELDDLRATLTFHEVTPLVRMGLLVPIVDGFDELLGVGGYDDAFSSLSTFIEDLDGTGRLIASARSTYYEQEFVARANKASALGAHVWRQIPIEILEWGDNEFEQYLHIRCKAEGFGAIRTKQITKNVADVFLGINQPLRSKPFFVSKTVDLILTGAQITKGNDLLEQLVENYVERERTEKLLDRRGTSILTNEQIRALFVELAEEMWNQETRELDQRSVREVAAYVLQTYELPENAQLVVTERVTAFAFLMTGQKQGSIAFEHEVFFAYFLAYRLSQGLSGGGTLALLLGRSVLPLDAARITARILDPSAHQGRLQGALSILEKAGAAASVRSKQTQENAGLIAATLLLAASADGRPVEGIDLGEIVVPGLDLSGLVLRKCRLRNIDFRRTKFSRTRLEKCSAQGVTLTEIAVDPDHTWLELEGIDIERQVIGLQIVRSSAMEMTYEPAKIRSCLRKVGLPAAMADAPSEVRDVPDHIVSLMERFGRAYLRSNPVCTSDEFLQNIFGDTSWPSLQDLLLSSGVVTLEHRDSKGRSKQKVFLRRQVLPEELLVGINRNSPAPNSVRRFWESVEAKYSRNKH